MSSSGVMLGVTAAIETGVSGAALLGFPVETTSWKPIAEAVSTTGAARACFIDLGVLEAVGSASALPVKAWRAAISLASDEATSSPPPQAVRAKVSTAAKAAKKREKLTEVAMMASYVSELNCQSP